MAKKETSPKNRLTAAEEEAAYLEWKRREMAAVDKEVAPFVGNGELHSIGVVAFHSNTEFGRPRRKGPKEVVLAKTGERSKRKRDKPGFASVDLTYIDPNLDRAAHHGLTHLPAEDRYAHMEETVRNELRRRGGR